MNWQAYKDAGYPEFSTLEDVIPVLEKMKEAYPATADGLATYGMNLFSDFDTDYFWNMQAVYTVLGKDPSYLNYGMEFDVRTHTGYSIFEEDSVYLRGLKFMNAMDKAGLLDPDSMTQTRSTARAKIVASGALAGWAGNPGWEAEGYYTVMFDEFVPSYRAVTNFPTAGFCISSDTDNLDAVLKFIDVTTDIENATELRSGPRGTIWDYNEEGIPSLTDMYYQLKEDNISGIPLEDGTVWEWWNTGGLAGNYYIGDQLIGITLSDWPDTIAMQYSTPLALDWTEHYGYPFVRAMMDDKNWEQAVETEAYPAFLTPDDEEMIMTKAALKDIIVPGSWQMIYAKDDAELEKIWQDMKNKCESLGIDDVVAQKLEDIAAAREAFAELVEK
jgi:multiple sugar transport system substrate-binding protein/putative aldouronate transport system substrate-binding protein